MHRKHLGSNQGMLFCFSSDKHYSFWMQNTHIPLDIGFIDSSGKLLEVHPLIPMSTSGVKSSTKCRYALETNRGWFKENGVKPGHQILKTNRKMAQTADPTQEQPVDNNIPIVIDDFRQAVEIARAQGWNIIITYKIDRRDGVRKKNNNIRKETAPDWTGNKNIDEVYTDIMSPPRTDFVGDYELMIGAKGIENLPGSTKVYDYPTGGNGPKITVRVVGAAGEPRSFFLDNILDYVFQTSTGLVKPEELTVEELERLSPRNESIFKGENPIESNPIEENKFSPENIQFEEIDEPVEDITFFDGKLPPADEAKRDLPESAKPPTENKKRRFWDGFRDMWDFLRKNEAEHKAFIKESQVGAGDSGNMMTEYWEELKKKRGEGLTEGQAILEYLKENEQTQKKERGSKKEKSRKK